MSEENQKTITVYSTPTCHFCNLAKEFFTANGIKYTDYNVLEDPEKGREMVERSGQMGVPVIFVGDEMVVGFNEPLIRQMLGM